VSVILVTGAAGRIGRYLRAGLPGLGFELGGDGYSIGLRCPAHPLARGLCSEAGPLGASSANLHHQRPLLTAAEISEAFGESVPVVVDGGACGGTASTVVDLTGDEPRCLREGSIPWSVILEVLAGS
jgi:tRNA A37 threonylcarbamoyladenosine synthetase subunit TsaC/SUA5/YrdC